MRRRARALLLAVTVTARVLDTQRAVSLPVDSERQRVVTVDASPLAVKRALRRYDARSHKYCGAVVANCDDAQPDVCITQIGCHGDQLLTVFARIELAKLWQDDN